ncbi:MAG TPA: ATP-binding protein [Baekduia sp.]|nr:ATP-binding protein [Baekduia sp.]
MSDVLRAPLRIPVALLLGLLGGVTCTVAWLLAGGGDYWPVWAWIGAGGAVGALVVVRAAWRLRAARARWTAAHVGLGAVAAGVVAGVWGATGGGPWLGWPLLGIGVAVSVHLLLAYADRLPPRPSERRLSARVDELLVSRRGALDAQVSELRRIERDLHDGAQSRLVALNVLLGRAEGRDDLSPAAARLVREARQEAVAAIAELRDLARGIAPPLLDERGLGSAIEALALRSPVAVVDVEADLDGRLPRSVEAAAYFVVAEALTNIAKHAPGARARVRLHADDGRLALVVQDDGPGGADPAGSGLVGLRHRVAALDGTLAVAPAPGGGTAIHVELPCGS